MIIKEWVKKIRSHFRVWTSKRQGAALVVSLMVTLVLVLLSLALVMQSSTEYVIAVNESDAFAALSYGEATLDWVNRRVIDYAQQVTPPTDLDDLLDGPGAGTGDDFLIDLSGGTGRTLNTAMDLEDLDTACGAGNTTCEREWSVKESLDWDGDGTNEDFEAFRIGRDPDGDGDWDGPRAEVYVRFIDNFDNTTVIDTDDTDFRARVLIVVDYPIFLKSDGTRDGGPSAPRGAARRRLVGRFAPAGNVAIRTDGDLEISGSLEVCGECGGVHANQNLNIGSATDDDSQLVTCAEATSTEGLSQQSDATDIRGGIGITGEVYIPVINPYDNRYVPKYEDFDTSADTTLPSWLQCPAPDNSGLGVNIILDPNTDPGATKYFALVAKKVAGQNYTQVYKAYWDTANTRWVWRLIDENGAGDPNGLNAVLDQCGRVVSGTLDDGTALVADPVPAYVTTPAPLWNGVGRTDGTGAGAVDNNTHFYGFSVGTGSKYSTSGCTADETLSTENFNDFNVNNFPRLSNTYWEGGAEASPAVDGAEVSAVDIIAQNLGPLPGTDANRDTALTTPNPVTEPSVIPAANRRDFFYEDCITKNKAEWSHTTGNMFTPMFGSVLFIYGNLMIDGGSNLWYVTTAGIQSATAQDVFAAPMEGRWRASFIVFNNADFQGNPIYGPASTTFQITMVAGRDITLGGTGGAGLGNQDQCPDMTGDCTATPLNVAGYEGMVLAHEEVQFAGNVTLDGFIIAEDAATCSDMYAAGESVATGSVQVHYDCEDPDDPWKRKSVRLVGWEEVQR